MRVPLFAAACVCALSAPDAFGAFGVIDDKSFFDGIEHTFLDFETKGDGSPVDLPFLGIDTFGPDEYSEYGVTFPQGGAWGNFPPPTFGGPVNSEGTIGDSLDAVGSWPTAIGVGTITFTVPVHAVGIGVVQGGWAGPPIEKQHQTKMTAFDAEGNVLGEVFFWGDLVDGGFGGIWKDGAFGDQFLKNPFGFLGIFSPDTPIARVRFTTPGAIFDDLHFSALPAPGAGAAFGLLALGAGLRRRRERAGAASARWDSAAHPTPASTLDAPDGCGACAGGRRR